MSWKGNCFQSSNIDQIKKENLEKAYILHTHQATQYTYYLFIKHVYIKEKQNIDKQTSGD